MGRLWKRYAFAKKGHRYIAESETCCDERCVFLVGFQKDAFFFFAKRHLAFGKQPAITTNTEMMKYWNRDNTGSDKASTTQQPSCQHLCYHNTLGGSQQDIHSTRVTSRSSRFASSTKRQLFHSLPAWRIKTLGSVRRRRWS